MHMFRTIGAALLAVASAMGPITAGADEPGGGIVSEVKAGVLQHDLRLIAADSEAGQAVNAEVLFRSPRILDAIWSPRPHLGASVSLEGETDQIYAGVTWTFRPFEEGALAPVWLSAFGGGALHNGRTDTTDRDRNSLGSRVLFRFGGEVGADVTDRISVSAYFAHISNAFLADRNEGLDQAGVRLGWRF